MRRKRWGVALADVTERAETYCLKLPYRKAVQFASVTPSGAPGFGAAIDLKKQRKFTLA